MVTIGYNKEWVKSVSKAEFLEHQKHHAGDTDLEADYDKIVGEPKKEEKPKKPAKE